MKKWLVILIFIRVSTCVAQAQPLSLTDCIQIGLENNLTVKQSQLQAEFNSLQVRQARLNRLPSVNAFANTGVNAGRSIDVNTNLFINESFTNGNLGANLGITLFNGLKISHQIQQSDYFAQGSAYDLEAARNALRINITVAYFQTLANQDLYEATLKQITTSQLQVDRADKQVKAGTVAEVDLLNLKAQLANDKALSITAKNALALSKVQLSQLMNIPSGTNFELERVSSNFPEVTAAEAEVVFEKAKSFLPEIKAADLRVRSARAGIKVARADYYPTLSLGAGLNTFASSSALSQFNTGQQIDQNLRQSGGLSLSIPIVNQFFVRNRVASADVNRRIAEVTAQNVSLQLRQTIEQAQINLTNAVERYRALDEQVQSLKAAFAAAESRLNAGTLNSFEYAIYKTNLDRATANLIQARYEATVRNKVLKFYETGGWE